MFVRLGYLTVTRDNGIRFHFELRLTQAPRPKPPRPDRTNAGAAPQLFASGGKISYLYRSLRANRIAMGRGGNNIVLPPQPQLSGGKLPPQPHLSGGKLPPLPYGGAAHEPTRSWIIRTPASDPNLRP